MQSSNMVTCLREYRPGAGRPPRVAILSTHPIQYHSPWFRCLAERTDMETLVLYCHEARSEDQAKAGFGVAFDWDVSLLDGYALEFLPNVSSRPGLGFWGMDTPELSTRIARREFDAVVLNGWHYKSACQAILACWRSRTPVLVRSDSHLKTPRHPLKKAAKWPFYRLLIPRLDACLPVGSWSREYFLHYGVKPERIFEVPHTVDSDRIAATASGIVDRQAALRRNWDLPEEDVVVVFSGKFIAKKRPLDFVRSVGKASRLGVRVSGLMVGDGVLRSACAAAAKESGAPIRFAGFLNQKEIVEAYVAADAMVLPSDGGETWGLVVNEAMACGLPCFLSDQVGSAADLIHEGRTGATFPCGDVDVLADLLKRYADRHMLKRMGQAAREKISGYTPRIAAARLSEAVIQTLVRSRCRAA